MIENKDKESTPPVWGLQSRTLESWFANVSQTGRGRKQAVSLFVDVCLVVASLWAAYSLRLGTLYTDFAHSLHVFVMLPVITVSAFAAIGVYRWVVRSANQRLFRQLLKGSFVSALSLLALLFLFPSEGPVPRSLVALYGIMIALSTFSMRLIWQAMVSSRHLGETVAIYGAGAAGQQLVQLLEASNEFRPVVFVDDNPAQVGTMVRGLPVLAGTHEDLAALLKRRQVARVIMAMPSLPPAEYQQKLINLEKLGFSALTMPKIGELVSGKATIDQVRDVSINDILGRQEVLANPALMREPITGKTVLVTGGGGSIGSELCRQILSLAPRRLIVLDHSEKNLYDITEEAEDILQQLEEAERPAFLPVLASVTDVPSLQRVFTRYPIDVVFHAAAYKHVPIIEAQPEQGILVNVFGTRNVMELSLQHGVSNFLLVSTDKAVRPANAMGASKRVAELVLQAQAAQSSRMCIAMVRFGNVLGSSGSVVPKFRKQIQAGGPVTLTHCDVTRYFMSIPEAAQLLIQASAIAEGGEVFVLDMGEPVRIEQLARTMVLLSGKKIKNDTGQPGDIEILESGLRPGEKMYEELFVTSAHQRTVVPRILFAREKYFSQDVLNEKLQVLEEAAISGDSGRVRSMLLDISAVSGVLVNEQHGSYVAEAP